MVYKKAIKKILFFNFRRPQLTLRAVKAWFEKRKSIRKLISNCGDFYKTEVNYCSEARSQTVEALTLS